MAEETNKPQPLTAEERLRMETAKEHIRESFPRIITVDGTIYKVKQISKRIRARIHALELEAYQLSGRQKESMPLRKAKKIQRKLDTIHAKTAAYYLLGNRAFLPWAFALKWRRLMMRSEEHIFAINNAAVNDDEMGFSFANWEITKQQLALSMKPIGDGVNQTLKRWESASEQTEQDATKKEDSK